MFRGLIGNYLSKFHRVMTIVVQKNSRVSSKTACFDDTLLDFCTPMSTVPGSHGVTAGDWSPGTTHSAPQGQGASRPMQATRCHLPRDHPQCPAGPGRVAANAGHALPPAPGPPAAPAHYYLRRRGREVRLREKKRR